MAQEEKGKKAKRPTAQKRMIQNEKRALNNRMFKSRIRSAIRSFEEAVSSQKKEAAKEGLNLIYKLMDKGVKKKIVKKNRSNRLKSKFSKQAASA